MGRTQEQRKENTRRRLLETATGKFVENGYAGSSLEDIARAAGFTKGAVYAHFRSKENLFFEVFALRASAQLDSVSADSRSGRTSTPGVTRENRRWTILVLEFMLYAVRVPTARRRLQTFFKSNRELIATALSDRASGATSRNVEQIGTELQILDLGYSVLGLVDDNLEFGTYLRLMKSILASHQSQERVEPSR